MTSAAETLSVGIVTFNHEAVIESTLRSLVRALPPGLPAQVWVLDNGSSDDSVAAATRVAAADSRITVEQNDGNCGYGKGNNLILRRVHSTYHLFLNPDVTIAEGALQTLIEFMRSQPDAGIVCPRMQFEDGRLQTLNRRNPTILDLFLSRFLPSSLRPLFAKRMGQYRMEDVGYDRSCHVPFVSGAFMLCRTSTLKAVGGFDERYFLYFEDADLSRKVQAGGWTTMYCPGAAAVHQWRRSAHHSYRAMYRFIVSAFRYFNKWGWQVW